MGIVIMTIQHLKLWYVKILVYTSLTIIDPFVFVSNLDLISIVIPSNLRQSTLQERIAKQRETQLAFLKQKGLLDDEKSLRGGAGGSVTGSPNLSTPRRTVGRRRM